MLKGLKTAVANLKLMDTSALIEQGRKAFMFGTDFTELQNPFKTDRDRRLWQQGYDESKRKWQSNPSNKRRNYANS